MRHAELFPVHAVIRLRLAQMQQQAVAQLAHRHGRFLREILQHAVRRRVAQQDRIRCRGARRRLAVEKFRVGDGMLFAAGHRDAMGEGKFLVAVFEMGRERDDVAVEMHRFPVRGGFEPVGVAPAREPLQQFGIGKSSVSRASARSRCVSGATG